MKGFKSFASATHLRLEPGITCIVGPNGSGKSNVVDALAWVMGEQGAKSLRGGYMEDVIFAGTAGRPPLGRAEVALTIDNTDGALPIDYTEVTISRTMFRSGGSEYAINGTSCRLLDIQELLSDSGIGREMHVIVGQGQLDAVLPRDARGAARLHRGGRRRPQAPQAQGTRAAQARGDGGQPHPDHRPHRRDPPPARPARAPGRDGPQGRRHPGRGPRRPAAPPRRRPGPAHLDARAGGRRRDRPHRPAHRGRGRPHRARVPGRRARVGGRGRPARARPGPGPLVCARPRCTERLTATGSLATERVRLLRQDLADEARDAGSGASSRDPEELRRQAAELLQQHEALVVEVADATAALRGRRGRAGRGRAGLRGGAAARSPASPVRSPTAARGWPGWPVRSPPRPPGSRRPRARSAGCARPSSAARARAAQAEREFAALESSIAAEEAGEEDLDAGYEQAAAHLDRLTGRARGAPGGRAVGGARPAVVHRPRGRPRDEPAPQGRGGRAARRRGRHAYDRRLGRLAACRSRPATRRRSPPPSAGPATRSPSTRWPARPRRSTGSGPTTPGAPGLLVAETAGSVDRSGWPSLPARGALGARRRVVPRPAAPGGRPAPRAGGPRRHRGRRRGPLVRDGRDRGDARRRRVRARLGPRRAVPRAPSLIEIQAAVDEARDRVTEADRPG